MMEKDAFLREALARATANLPYGENPGNREHAVRMALAEAHSELSQAQFFSAIDALGGHEALVVRLVAAMPDPECPLCDPGNRTLLALLHQDALQCADIRERHVRPVRTTAGPYNA